MGSILNWNRYWNDLICLATASPCSSIYMKMEDYETENKCTLTLNTNKKKSQQPQFQLHLLIVSCGRQWVCWHIGCCAVPLLKMMPYTMFQLSQTFCEWQIEWMFPLSHLTVPSFVWTHMSIWFCLSAITDTVNIVPYSYTAKHLAPVFSHFKTKFQGVPFIQKHQLLILLHGWTFIWLFSHAHF